MISLRKYKVLVILVGLIGISFYCYAQPVEPGGDPGAPLDGGLLSVLGGSGLAYLLIRHKLRKKKKE